jgi:aminoglycoside phosphotransferase (APT) family kinase protein
MLLTRLGAGREAEVYAWGEGHVLKLFWPEFSRADAEWEAGLIWQIWLMGLPSPKAVDVLETGGRWGVVLERVEGVPLTQYIAGDPTRMHFAAQMLGVLHRQIHARPASQLPAQRQKLVRSLETSPLGEGQKGALLAHLHTLPEGTSLCHGDFHPENVLVSGAGVQVIDWPGAACGNPAADLARSALLILHSVLPEDLPARAEILEGRERFFREYLEHYAQGETGALEAQIAAWLPLVAAARLREGIEEEESVLMGLITEGLQRAGS